MLWRVLGTNALGWAGDRQCENFENVCDGRAGRMILGGRSYNLVKEGRICIGKKGWTKAKVGSGVVSQKVEAKRFQTIFWPALVMNCVGTF